MLNFIIKFLEGVEFIVIQNKLYNILSQYKQGELNFDNVYDYYDVYFKIIEDSFKECEYLIDLEEIMYNYYEMSEFDVLAFEGIDNDILENEDNKVLTLWLVELRKFIMKHYYFNEDELDTIEENSVFNSFEEALTHLERQAECQKNIQIQQPKEDICKKHSFADVPFYLEKWLIKEVNETDARLMLLGT